MAIAMVRVEVLCDCLASVLYVSWYSKECNGSTFSQAPRAC